MRVMRPCFYFTKRTVNVNVRLCWALFREFQFPVEQVAETLRRAFVLTFLKMIFYY